MDGEYYKTEDSVKEYIKLAEGIDGQNLINQLDTFLNPAARLLEIGSGPGKDWFILTQKYEITGSDNSAVFVKRLRELYSEAIFYELDATDLEIDQSFDAIYSNKVLHHLTDDQLKKSIERQAEILNDQGLVAHSFWNGEGSEVYKGLFVNYQSKESLSDLFDQNFEIVLLETYTEFEDGDSLFLIARKK
jgi:ubiquinone/menaquinone biosynthesis C-methylase UbiE